jgi:hypothetical protein
LYAAGSKPASTGRPLLLEHSGPKGLFTNIKKLERQDGAAIQDYAQNLGVVLGRSTASARSGASTRTKFMARTSKKIVALLIQSVDGGLALGNDTWNVISPADTVFHMPELKVAQVLEQQ